MIDDRSLWLDCASGQGLPTHTRTQLHQICSNRECELPRRAELIGETRRGDPVQRGTTDDESTPQEEDGSAQGQHAGGIMTAMQISGSEPENAPQEDDHGYA